MRQRSLALVPRAPPSSRAMAKDKKEKKEKRDKKEKRAREVCGADGAKRVRSDGAGGGGAVSPSDAPPPPPTPRAWTAFADAPFAPSISNALASAGFPSPTPIQQRAWPVACDGADVVAVAKTGSGKTLAFLLPIFHQARRTHWSPYDRVGVVNADP